MGILKCNNDDCAYNHSGERCMTSVLDIAENGQCKSYREDSKAKRIRDAEFAAELGIEGRDIYSAIDCAAENCVFNKNTHCNAGNVDMRDGLFFTRCKTRTKD